MLVLVPDEEVGVATRGAHLVEEPGPVQSLGIVGRVHLQVPPGEGLSMQAVDVLRKARITVTTMGG